jgi:hypothetical protein
VSVLKEKVLKEKVLKENGPSLGNETTGAVEVNASNK